MALPSNGASTRGKEHLATIDLFFRIFARDFDAFRALWVEEPLIEIPFAPPNLPKMYVGREQFDQFWTPIFAMTGKFDWTVEQAIVSENGSEVVVRSRSDVDVDAAGTPLRYQGSYIQIFTFDDQKIKKFTEFIDTYAMAQIYKF